MDDLSLVCPHGVPTGTACLTCHQTKTPLEGAAQLCPHSYANLANCPDCTPRTPARRTRPTPTPPALDGADCAVCSLTRSQHDLTNALVAYADRHDYEPRKATHALLV